MATTRPYTKIGAAEALKSLGDAVKGVTVQMVRKGTKTVNGKAVEVLIAEDKPLSAAGVHSAKKWKNGQVTITTVDGKKYPKDANTAAREDEEEAAA